MLHIQKNVFNLDSDLPFSAERKKIISFHKFVCNTCDKENYVVHIGVLEEALNHGLIQEAWLKPYIDMNTKSKTDFQKDFFKLINNSVFGKTMENIRKGRSIKLVTTDKRRNQLVSEPNYLQKVPFRKLISN